MPEQSPRQRAGKTPSDEALLAAAASLVAAQGIGGLTLRPLAGALDVSVTVLTHRHGDRAGIVAAICRAALEKEAAWMDEWRTTLSVTRELPAPLAAALVESMLAESTEQTSTILYLELRRAAAWDSTAGPALDEWTRARRAFWDHVAGRAGLPPPMLACGWWHGYVLAEQAYGAALAGDPAYALLRRVCLQRLFGGPLAVPDSPDAPLFERLRERMHVSGMAAEADDRKPGWAASAARECGIRLAAQGVGALTHRSIAAAMGVAHTTLSYRFPTQQDLVFAGLQYVTRHILRAVEAETLPDVQRLRLEDDGAKLDLARATFAVALEAVRVPALAPATAHMRARRGGHLVKVFDKYLPGAAGIDALCAQLVSLGLTGLTNASPPGEEGEQAVAAAFKAAAGWLARPR